MPCRPVQHMSSKSSPATASAWPSKPTPKSFVRNYSVDAGRNRSRNRGGRHRHEQPSGGVAREPHGRRPRNLQNACRLERVYPRGPLGARRPQPPIRTPLTRKFPFVRNRTNPWALHGRAQGICNAQHRVFPPASGHLSSVIGDLLLGRGGEPAHEYQTKADALEAYAGVIVGLNPL